MSDLPEPDPIRADARRERKRRSLPPDPACLQCGISGLDTLAVYQAVSLPGLFEAHHVLGKATDPDLTVVLCRNCHARQTAAQHDHGAVAPPGRYGSPDSLLERVMRGLLSLAVFLHDLAHTLTAKVAGLSGFVAGLDSDFPGWREKPWAR